MPQTGCTARIFREICHVHARIESTWIIILERSRYLSGILRNTAINGETP